MRLKLPTVWMTALAHPVVARQCLVHCPRLLRRQSSKWCPYVSRTHLSSLTMLLKTSVWQHWSNLSSIWWMGKRCARTLWHKKTAREVYWNFCQSPEKPTKERRPKATRLLSTFTGPRKMEVSQIVHMLQVQKACLPVFCRFFRINLV